MEKIKEIIEKADVDVILITAGASMSVDSGRHISFIKL